MCLKCSKIFFQKEKEKEEWSIYITIMQLQAISFLLSLHLFFIFEFWVVSFPIFLILHELVWVNGWGSRFGAKMGDQAGDAATND